MKKAKIAYWVTTALLTVLLVPGIFFINSPMSIEAMNHLGVPADWFRYELEIAKFIGGLVLIIPACGSGMYSRIWSRFKEWAYIGIGIDFVSAFIALVAVDGMTPVSFFPIITFLLLVVSYHNYHKIKGN